MVKEVSLNGHRVYICEECGYIYGEWDWAEECQEWDITYASCEAEVMEEVFLEEGGIKPLVN